MPLKVSMRIAAITLIATTIPMIAPAQEENAAKPPAYTVLYTFTGGPDGAIPSYFGTDGLMRDRRGNLYGATGGGGDPSCGGYIPIPNGGCGVVFEVDRNGNETALHTFTGPDGANPVMGLVDWEGNLYGTTAIGGAYEFGTIFKIDRNGNETVLYSFTGGADGGFPQAGLIRGKDGNLYGTTLRGGYGVGVVFKVDRHGNETALYTFAGPDGASPGGGLVADRQGTFTARLSAAERPAREWCSSWTARARRPYCTALRVARTERTLLLV